MILVALGESSFSEAESRFLEQPESWQQDPAGLEIHGAILDGLGTEALLAGDFDKAESLIRRAVAASPKRSTAWFHLGQVLRVHGDWEAAIEAYEKSAACTEQAMESQIASWLTLPILYESTQECERVRTLFRSGMKQLVQSYPVESIEMWTPLFKCVPANQFSIGLSATKRFGIAKRLWTVVEFYLGVGA